MREANSSPRAGLHAIRAAYAFDGTRFLAGGATVFVEEDRIAGVEPGRVEVPGHIEVADYAGTVLPGLIDCHTHLVADATLGGLERAGVLSEEEIDGVVADSLRAHASAGVTTVRDLGDRGFRTLAFRGRVGMPRIVASGPPLTTPGGHCHFLGGAVASDQLAAAVAQHAERGVDVIKVMASGGFATPGTDPGNAQFTAAELTTLTDQAHRLGLPVVAHAHSLLSIRNAMAAGADGIAHFSGLTAQGSRIDDALLEEVANRGVYVDLTLGNDRALYAQMMTALPPPLADLMARLGIPNIEAFYTDRIGLLTRLHAHGVPVVTGVDSGLAPAKRHGNAWRTVGELVDAGYPVAEALAAATSVAAQACGLERESGRLNAGFAADILIVDGNLADDPSLLARPRHVVIRGTPIRLP